MTGLRDAVCDIGLLSVHEMLLRHLLCFEGFAEVFSCQSCSLCGGFGVFLRVCRGFLISNRVVLFVMV